VRILQISTYDTSGGASRAAYRLHQGLRQLDEDCRMMVRHKASQDDSVLQARAQEGDQKGEDTFFLSKVIQGQYIDANRTEMSNTLFSLPYPGLDLSSLPLIREADVINLHWVARYQSAVTLSRLFSIGKPVIWTLHDQWAFTGGCHYSAGCEKYRNECMKCPQLEDDPFDLPAAVLKDKLELFQDADLTIVTPSRWMAKCAQQSRLFQDLRIEVIPNSLETDVYTPSPRHEARERLGLGGEPICLLFGGEDGNERRKGFKELMAAIRCCLEEGKFQELVENGKFRLICFGHPNDEIESLGIPVDALGYLDSEEDIRDAYAGADIFVLPSLEDNLPNTILEAMSCGTPVVAFDTGGISDMVQHDVTGLLVPLGDVSELGRALLALVFDPDKRVAMGNACRKRAETEYPLDVQARNYLTLYEELVQKKSASKQRVWNVPEAEVWEEGTEKKPHKELSAPQEDSLGSHFGTIYDGVVLKALRKFAPYIYDQWEQSEVDRKDRYEQTIRLADLLKESESDRKARLDQINKLNNHIDKLNNQITEITQLFGESEADRRATLNQISELAEMLDREQADWKTEVERLNRRPDIFREKEERHIMRSRLFEALQTGIHNMRHEVERAYMRAGAAEKGWRDLESTFVVRQARRLGLIQMNSCQSVSDEESQAAGRSKERLIAVDMTPVLPGGVNGGAKIFAMELLRSLQQEEHAHCFLLLTASWSHDELVVLESANMSRLCVLKGKTREEKTTTARYPGLLRRSLGRINRTMKQVSQTGTAPRRLLAAHGVDLLFCPFTAPTYAEPGIPTVSVIYDLQHLDFPQFFSPQEIGVRNAFMKQVGKKSDHVVCISEYVRQTVLKYLQTDPKRTHVAHVSIHSRLSGVDQQKGNLERASLGIDHHPYMFYPANFWPHKNHRMLLTAYGMFLSRNPNSNIDLVFTGALDDQERETKRAAEQMGLRDRAHFLGFLSQEQLGAVWHGCKFLIFPSLYEGFGIPVLEAMSMGKPVLCSNTCSLPEVAGEAALYFDPRKPGEMVNCMERIVRDPGVRKELIEHGIAQAGYFSQKKMRERYAEIFETALGGSSSPYANVSGIYDDGWIGDEMHISIGPAERNRELELHVVAPAWLPSARIKLRLKDDGKTLKQINLRRGRETTINFPLTNEGRHLSLTVTPTFRPSECKMGEDNRILGAECKGCWIVHADQERFSLLREGEECLSP
jgi:glycosyltransferase involved in cell wall biosynthesis